MGQGEEVFGWMKVRKERGLSEGCACDGGNREDLGRRWRVIRSYQYSGILLLAMML